MHENMGVKLRCFTLQILVVPAAIAEVGDLDFEAVLCGCLLLKVNAEAYEVYSDIFKAGERVLGSPSDWSGLHNKLANALQVWSCPFVGTSAFWLFVDPCASF